MFASIWILPQSVRLTSRLYLSVPSHSQSVASIQLSTDCGKEVLWHLNVSSTQPAHQAHEDRDPDHRFAQSAGRSASMREAPEQPAEIEDLLFLLGILLRAHKVRSRSAQED